MWILYVTERIKIYHVFGFFPGMVDCIFADVAQPDQARIVAINAHNFLKNAGHVVISIKVSSNENGVPSSAMCAHIFII